MVGEKGGIVDVVGVGLNAFDTLIFLPHFPPYGGKVRFERAVCSLGGQVATAIIACARWGLRTRYVGTVGDDEAGEKHRQALEQAGVEAHLIVVPGTTSQRAYILVDRSTGERTILWDRPDGGALRPEWLEPQWITRARLLHLDGHDPAAAVVAARWARQAGVAVVADFDNVYPGMEELLPLVDYLLVSQEFPVRLLGESDPRRALLRFRELFRPRVAAVTLGAAGAVALSDEGVHWAPGFVVDAVDTTGAGDVFHAGFIYGILQGWSVARCLEFGCAAAALNCTGVGARGGLRPVEEIVSFMKTASRTEGPTASSVAPPTRR